MQSCYNNYINRYHAKIYLGPRHEAVYIGWNMLLRSACTKPEKHAIMYTCVKDIDFACVLRFYDYIVLAVPKGWYI